MIFCRRYAAESFALLRLGLDLNTFLFFWVKKGVFHYFYYLYGRKGLVSRVKREAGMGRL
jgi:hypothetical protein